MIYDELDFETALLLNEERLEEKSQYPLPLNIKSAQGCFLVADNNKRYLDLTSNRENQPLGYRFNDPHNNFFFDSNLFNPYDAQKLNNHMKSITGLEKSLFYSSTAEAYEKLNSFIKNFIKEQGKEKILVSAINTDKALLQEIKYERIPLNNDSLVKSILAKSVAAVIIEITQISDEILTANSEYLKIVREICSRNKALLIFDVTSVAPLRLLNDFFNYDSSIVPDILIASNSLSNGIPLGVVSTNSCIDSSILESNKAGTISLAYRFGSKFIHDFKQNNLKEIITSNAKYLEKCLNLLAQNHISVLEIKSYGMLFTIDADFNAYEMTKLALNKGLIVEAIAPNRIKLSPPYNLGKEEIDILINILDETIDELVPFDRLNY